MIWSGSPFEEPRVQIQIPTNCECLFSGDPPKWISVVLFVSLKKKHPNRGTTKRRRNRGYLFRACRLPQNGFRAFCWFHIQPPPPPQLFCCWGVAFLVKPFWCFVGCPHRFPLRGAMTPRIFLDLDWRSSASSRLLRAESILGPSARGGVGRTSDEADRWETPEEKTHTKKRLREDGWAGGLGWVGLGWVGLGWVGLGWVGLGWVGLGWVGLGWVGLGWVGWVGWLHD